jgi:hypothetical protein
VDQFGDMPLNTPIVNSALWPAEIKQIADKYGHGVTLAQILEQEK